MTETWKTNEAFTSWYYAKDFTHVSFFHDQTFDFIAENFGFELLGNNDERMMLLKRKMSAKL